MPRRHWAVLTALVLLAGVLAGCAAIIPAVEPTKSSTEIGVASYYAHKFHGRRTASGEVYDMHDLTAAHRTLPFGTRVRVINLHNRKSIVVTINDRGPFMKGRIIDVSYEAAKQLGMVGPGTARVQVEILAS